MMKEQTGSMVIEILIVFLCIMTIMIGLWAMDIGAGAMILNAGLKQNGINAEVIAGNGWQFQEACQQYHTGIYIVLAGMMILSILAAAKIFDARIILKKDWR